MTFSKKVYLRKIYEYSCEKCSHNVSYENVYKGKLADIIKIVNSPPPHSDIDLNKHISISKGENNIFEIR